MDDSIKNTHTWQSVVHSFENVVVGVSSEKFIFRDQVKLRLNCFLLLRLSFFPTISSKVRAYKLTVWEKEINNKYSILSSTDEFYAHVYCNARHYKNYSVLPIEIHNSIINTHNYNKFQIQWIWNESIGWLLLIVIYPFNSTTISMNFILHFILLLL